MRAQTSLPAVGLALVLVTAVGTMAVLGGHAVFAGADRQPLDRGAAAGLADRLVDPDGGVAERPNVLNASNVAALNETYVRDVLGLVDDRAVAIRLGDRTVVEAGHPAGGESFERIVLVERRENASRSPRLPAGRGITLPRRVSVAEIELSPPPELEIRGVRADGRVVLHDDSGLAGTYRIRVSPYETTRLTVDASDSLPAGSVTVRFRPPTTRKATLEVTVDG